MEILQQKAKALAVHLRRAAENLEQIAGEPHPEGSAAYENALDAIGAANEFCGWYLE